MAPNTQKTFTVNGKKYINKEIFSQLIMKSTESLNKYFRKVKDKIYKEYVKDGKVSKISDTEKVATFKEDFAREGISYIERCVSGGAYTKYYALDEIASFIKKLNIHVSTLELEDTLKRLSLFEENEINSFITQMGGSVQNQDFQAPQNSISKEQTIDKDKLKQELEKEIRDELKKELSSTSTNIDNSKIENLLEQQIKSKDSEIERLREDYEKRLNTQKLEKDQKIELLEEKYDKERGKVEKLILVKDIISSILSDQDKLKQLVENDVKKLALGQDVKLGDLKQLASGINKTVQLDVQTGEYKVVEDNVIDADFQSIDDNLLISKKTKAEKLLLVMLIITILTIILLLFYFYIFEK